MSKQGKISLFEKRNKTAFIPFANAADDCAINSNLAKVFWFFFSKKNYILHACLSLAVSRPQCGLALAVSEFYIDAEPNSTNPRAVRNPHDSRQLRARRDQPGRISSKLVVADKSEVSARPLATQSHRRLR
jgi:hypothetical protein